MAAKFIHLRVHSSYSLSEGAMAVKDIAERAAATQMPSVAITDSGNLFGSLEFSLAAAKTGVQPIIGCVVNIGREARLGKLVLLAQNEEGYKNLLKLVSKSYLNSFSVDYPEIMLDDLAVSSSGLIALTGGAEGVLATALISGDVAKAEEILLSLKKIFYGTLYVEVTRLGTEKEKKIEPGLLNLAYAHNIPLAATNDVHFATPEIYEAADILLCIADGKYQMDEDRRRISPEQYFKTANEMAELFADIPEAVENTVVIAKRCAVMAVERQPILPNFPTSEGRSEAEELKIAAQEGLEKRLMDIPEAAKKPYRERLEYELNVIIGMNFPGYFLIVSDFIRWSKVNEIPVGPGRGSGAGSVAAWALLITDLDPLRFGLLFERFLNPDRVSMPDFDIDFCQEQRDKVINYVREKYGHDRVAQIITFGKLQARAVLRDVGRVLQMPYSQVDKICKMIPFNPIDPITLSKAIELDPLLKAERESNEEVRRLLDIGLKLEGLHRHASTHAAGIVIADRPLIEIVPLYYDPRSEIPAVQYSMKYAEAAGLVKFDFLGLKTLTVIHHALKAIEEQGIKIDIAKIPYDDLKTFALLAKGDTVGVFQVEGFGMRDALRKMRPDKIEDIIALISLYRPGPMENIPAYIARKHGLEKPDYIHPLLEETLKETFGVIIYQEQVMKIAQVLAGYSLGAADLLRRAMGKKNLAEMAAQREQFVSGAVKNGIDKNKAQHIFELVDKFAGYGFNKSHAAAYAIISYQTAYLKANYPVEFLVASMNLDIGDTDKLNIFRQEAVSHGIKILPPDINKSGARFSIEKDESGNKSIRYALGALKGVGIPAMELMMAERQKNGPFKDLFDFARRSDSKAVNKRQIESLAKCGAFDALNPNRRQVFDSANTLTRYNGVVKREESSNQVNLFGGGGTAVPETVPILPAALDWQEPERSLHDFEALGFYLSTHPLDAYKQELAKLKTSTIRGLQDMENDAPGAKGKKVRIAGVVTATTHRAAAKKRFTYLQLSDPTGTIEISVFDDRLISEARDLIEGKKPLLINADCRKDEGGVRLIADSIRLLDGVLQNQPMHLRIFLAGNPDALKSILGKSGEGRAKVRLVVQADGFMETEIALPGTYAITGQCIEKLKSLREVAEVVEG